MGRTRDEEYGHAEDALQALINSQYVNANKPLVNSQNVSLLKCYRKCKMYTWITCPTTIHS